MTCISAHCSLFVLRQGFPKLPRLVLNHSVAWSWIFLLYPRVPRTTDSSIVLSFNLNWPKTILYNIFFFLLVQDPIWGPSLSLVLQLSFISSNWILAYPFAHFMTNFVSNISTWLDSKYTFVGSCRERFWVSFRAHITHLPFDGIYFSWQVSVFYFFTTYLLLFLSRLSNLWSYTLKPHKHSIPQLSSH